MPGVRKTMQEFKGGSLRSGSATGSVVRSRKQAIAIALSEQRKAGQPVPKPRGTRPMPAPHPGVEALPVMHTSKHH